MKKLSSKIIVLITVLIIFLVIALFFIFRPKTNEAPMVSIDTRAQPMEGNPKAPITIVAFEDFKCENCKRYSTTLYPQIKRDYIDTGKAKYFFIRRYR